MDKYDITMYNQNAGKNIGRDSLDLKEGKQICDIPNKKQESVLTKLCSLDDKQLKAFIRLLSEELRQEQFQHDQGLYPLKTESSAQVLVSSR